MTNTPNGAVTAGASAPASRVALDKFVEANRYYAGTFLPDGRVAFLIPRLLDQADIGIGAEATEMAGLSELFSYADQATAISAWAIWHVDGLTGEPILWVRHRPSNRRRTNGDPAREYVAE